jgi:hypothetical protein
MSKEADFFEALSDTITGISSPTFTCTTRLQAFDSLPDRSVLLVPDTLEREPAGGGGQRWKCSTWVIVRSKIESDTPSETGLGRMLDDVRSVLNAIAGDVAIQAAGSAFQCTLRQSVQYVISPRGDHGRPAGGLLRILTEWVE